jgi:hypothetical protein
LTTAEFTACGTIVDPVPRITSTEYGITNTDMTKITTKGQVTIPKRLISVIWLPVSRREWSDPRLIDERPSSFAGTLDRHDAEKRK